jgi:hypothetical protein
MPFSAFRLSFLHLRQQIRQQQISIPKIARLAAADMVNLHAHLRLTVAQRLHPQAQGEKMAFGREWVWFLGFHGCQFSSRGDPKAIRKA